MSTEQGVAASSRLATPELLARIAGLELRARAVVEGVISGMHRSPHRGYSVEFAQHRGYVPGDDLRFLDWKVWGRSERWVIRQYRAETNLVAWLLLDCSASMDYAGAKAHDRMRKIDWARLASAAIGWHIPCA